MSGVASKPACAPDQIGGERAARPEQPETREPRVPGSTPASPAPRADASDIFFRLDLSRGAPYSGSEYVRKACWRIVQASLFRVTPARIRARLLRLFGANVHPTAHFRGTVRIHHPWLLSVGRFSSLGENVQVYNLGPISIGEHTCISQNAHLCAGTHDHTSRTMPLIRSQITIGSGVWVCADAFIGPDVGIGDNSVVAARAVVIADVPRGAVVGGNPARVLATAVAGREQRP